MTRIPTEQELRIVYEKAPSFIKEYVISTELLKAFETIRTEHKLHFDEAGKLTDALVSVFLEMRPMSEFPNLLREALEQNSATYSAVLKDVNEKIFTVFREKILTQSNKEGPAETDIEKSAAPEPASPTRATSTSLRDRLELGVSHPHEVASVNTLNDSQPQNETPSGKKPPEAPHPDPYREPIE